MPTQDGTQEKRRHNRKKVKITALLKMGVHLNGRGFAKDVSRGGMCLVSPGLFQFMKQSQMNDFMGAHIRVMFPSHSLTVNGAIVRIDAVKGEVAISITSTSDNTTWEKYCVE